MRKNKIKAAVIGLGFGETHLKALEKNKFCDVIKICDNNKYKAKYFGKKYQKKFIKNYKSLINNNKINFVSIATYDDTHFKILRDTIKKNKNVFIEKPICQTFNQLKIINRLLNKNKKIKISTNMVLRNHPKFLKIKELTSSGQIGKIYHIEGEYNYGRFHKLTNGWRGRIPYYSVMAGGGIHIIDLFRWYVKSKFEKVIGIDNNLSSKKSIFKFSDTTTALVKFKNGVTGKITANFPIKSNHHHVLNIYGEKGNIISDMKNLYISKSKNFVTKNKIIKFKINKKYKYGIIDNFIYSILGKKKPLYDKSIIIHNMCTALSIDKSLKSKKWEKIKF